MNNFITILAIVLIFQFTQAKNAGGQTSSDQEQLQKSKAALEQLLKSKIIVLDPKDNTFKLDFKNDSTKSILEQLKNDGLLNEEIVDRGPWCE